jgi:hypothetical protein
MKTLFNLLSLFSFKLLNPWNFQVTSNNSQKFVQIDNLKSLNIVPKSYDAPVNKRFYLSMEFNKIDNTEYQNHNLYSLAASKKQVFTPQINKISMMMPPVPPLYQWDQMPKVIVKNIAKKKTIFC